MSTLSETSVGCGKVSAGMPFAPILAQPPFSRAFALRTDGCQGVDTSICHVTGMSKFDHMHNQ